MTFIKVFSLVAKLFLHDYKFIIIIIFVQVLEYNSVFIFNYYIEDIFSFVMLKYF